MQDRHFAGAVVHAGAERGSAPGASAMGLIPRVFGPHPRVFCTPDDLERVRHWAHEVDWVQDRLRKLRQAVLLPFELPKDLGSGPEARAICQKAVGRIREIALAAAIDRDVNLLGKARALAVQWARAYLALPITGIDNKVAGGSLGESHTAVITAQMYDLLEPEMLSESDRFVLRAMLREMVQVLDRAPHRTCGNHNTWTLTGRLAIGAVLGDPDVIRGALEGVPAQPIPSSPDTPTFRYGLLHQIGHDFLGDGFHWERTCGYHMYTFMAMAECAFIMGNLGVDLWHAEVPVAMESLGYDLHRSYGPRGTRKLANAVEAILHCAYGSGRFPFLHDSHIEDWGELNIWGPVLARAYDATQNPNLAWALAKMAGEGPYKPPAVLRPNYEVEFVRVRHKALGPVESPWTKDKTFAQTGVTAGGHSLFPAAGHGVLRADVSATQGASVFCYWGPHSAGHQSPCALHVDIDTPHRRGTGTVDTNGYADAKHLTWLRSTIAHNTVTVDGKPMFPYDLPTQSIWEADSWRRRTSDGQLQLFQHEPGQAGFSAIRASNELVYPGVRLDRTVVLTHGFAIDAFRVFSDAHHVYDWAMHVIGEPDADGQGTPLDLGEQIGYRHLTDAMQLPEQPSRCITWTELHAPIHAHLAIQDGAATILARRLLDGHGKMGRPYGSTPYRSTVIVRKAGMRALFLSVWSWHGKPAMITSHQTDSDCLTLTVEDENGKSDWVIPIQNSRVTRR